MQTTQHISILLIWIPQVRKIKEKRKNQSSKKGYKPNLPTDENEAPRKKIKPPFLLRS